MSNQLVKSILFISVLTILLLPKCEAGYLEGAPCSTQNTAFLEATGLWRLPPVAVQCVDISGMGNRTRLPFTPEITNATTLYADHMNLVLFPKFATFRLPNLEMIDLSGNKIRKLSSKSLRFTRKIETLLLADNNVYIPKRRPLLVSSSLTTLSLSNNQIRRLTNYTFSKLPKLRVLYLDRNLLKHLRPDVIKPLTNLKYLHVGNNRLTELPSKSSLPDSLKIFITKGNPV
ncbi:protein artichoke [Agrilus planipennis]|uniref:Protein artichoke n=1 Tax=Agrilus planipennis TaxID=224129 RepID=A0A7F5RFL7_AGRPL|nr:protein artichoke [Agrilus planipennis]